MFQPSDYPPLPGMWATRAQDALDALSDLSTPDEVANTFGSARNVTEAILGTPIAGGAATKRAIRAVGQLLAHHLGPAIAAEALSWAAAIDDWISPSSIEIFIEYATSSASTFRPLRLSDGPQLLVCIENAMTGDSETKRRQALLDYWDDAHPLDRHIRLAAPVPPEVSRARQVSFSTIPVALGRKPGRNTNRSLRGSARGNGVFHLDPQSRLVLSDHRWDDLAAELAKARGLLEVPEPIFAHLLVEHTALVLENPECPDELKSRIVHPYDEATLELALRAGPEHFELATVRRLLDGVDADEARNRFGDELFLYYLQARGACGLITASDLLSGDLTDLDLSDQATAIAVFGSKRKLPADFVAAVLINHPLAISLIGLMHKLSGHGLDTALPVVRRILDEAPLQVAVAVLGRYSTGALRRILTPADRHIAEAAEPRAVANCPGIPASRRHRLAWATLHDEPEPNWHIGFDGWLDGRDETEVFDDGLAALLRSELTGRSDLDMPDEAIEADWFTRYYLGTATLDHRGKANFAYPEAVRRLEAPFLEAPGWTVTLPANEAELRRNAELMRNCTASYEDDIWGGRCSIVIVHDPDGRRYNVQIDRCGNGRFQVGQINSWANEGICPDWIEPAFQQRLATPPVTSSVIVPGDPSPRHHPRRTCRRERASRARRARR